MFVKFHFCLFPDSFGSLTRLREEANRKGKASLKRKTDQRNLKKRGVKSLLNTQIYSRISVART